MSGRVRVFVENEAGSNQKNIFDEKSLQFQKSYTVSRPYPYPYGFIIDTQAEDGDNVDCFIITEKKLKTGDIVEALPIGMMQQIEDGKEDNNILAVLPDEEITSASDTIKSQLTNFITHVFDHKKDKKIMVGGFLDKDSAVKYIHEHRDTK